jgi:hypothetical protein
LPESWIDLAISLLMLPSHVLLSFNDFIHTDYCLGALADLQLAKGVHMTPLRKNFLCKMPFFHHTCTVPPKKSF